MAKYTKEEADQFCELASEIGIGPAMRELGMPGHYMTARKWLDDRGIVIEIDTVKSKAREWGVWYTDNDLTMTAQEVVNKVSEMLTTEDLTAQDVEKLTNSLKKAVETIRTIAGKDAKNDSATDASIEQLLSKFDEKEKQG